MFGANQAIQGGKSKGQFLIADFHVCTTKPSGKFKKGLFHAGRPIQQLTTDDFFGCFTVSTPW